LDTQKSKKSVTTKKKTGSIPKRQVLVQMDLPLIVLDIDETLIYACLNPIKKKQPNWTMPSKNGQLSIYKRPHLDKFLEFCFINFNVAFWTAGNSEYADRVIKFICPEHQPKFVWSLDRCTPRITPEGEEYNKDIKKITRRKWPGQKYRREQILMVDDNFWNMCKNWGNGIVMPPYTGQESDDALSRLINFIYTFYHHDDWLSIDKLWAFREFVKTKNDSTL
jgi:TFIIF-interacting CTD phosphatase-like protein